MFPNSRTLASLRYRKNILIVSLLTFASGIGFAMLSRGVRAATTWNVSVGSPGTCTTLDPNCASIGGAVAAAAGGDTIKVAAGTYNEWNIGIDKDLTINGAGAKTTIVNAQQNGRVFDTCCGTIIVSGLTIKNGLTGAITMTTGTKSQPASNRVGAELDGAGIDGGGILNQGTLTLTDCTISDNATANGASSVIIFNAPKSSQRFAHTAKAESSYQAPPGQPGGSGGGIYNGGTLTLNNCTVSGNRTGSGGDSDTSAGNGGDGGGVFSNGTLMVTNSTIADNRTGRGGSIVSSPNATSTSSVTNGGPSPGSGGEGGGISNNGSLSLRNSTIADNRTGPAGGNITPINQAAKSATRSSASDVAIASPAGGNGGGVYSGATVANVTVISTIIAANRVPEDALGPDVFTDSAVSSNGYNLIGIANVSTGFTQPTDQTGTSATPLDPALSPLTDNGGQTQTMALLISSPAIDRGINSGCQQAVAKTSKSAQAVCGLPYDQRGQGFPRTVDRPNANAAGGDGTDVGAFEVQPCAPDNTSPVIVCPGSITKFADSGQTTATVNPSTPAASDNCALQSVVGVRSDGKPLNAPYPMGVTTITWTATDASGNKASCGQSIIVMQPSSPRTRIIP